MQAYNEIPCILQHVFVQVHVIPPAVSHYVIRTQPFEMAVSTVESVALALSVLEQRQQIFDVLVQPLVKLCQHQVSYGNYCRKGFILILLFWSVPSEIWELL